jgi:hypothetical protein
MRAVMLCQRLRRGCSVRGNKLTYWANFIKSQYPGIVKPSKVRGFISEKGQDLAASSKGSHIFSEINLGSFDLKFAF